MVNPGNTLEVKSTTAGNSGLRLTNFPSVGVLATNAQGDVVAAAPSVTNGFAWGLTGNSGTGPATNFIGTTDAQDLVFKTNNTEAMRIFASGNVGIGTNTASEKLHVTGRIRQDAPLGLDGFLLVNGSNVSSTTEINPGIDIFHDNANVYGFNLGYTTATGRWSNQVFLPTHADYVVSTVPTGTLPTQQSDFTARLLVRGDTGNVGIGTTSPANKLEITQGTAGNSGLRLTNFPSVGVLATNAQGDVVAAAPSVTNGFAWGLTGNSGTDPATNFIGTTDAQDLVVKTNGVERIRASSGGVVTISSNSVGRTLDVFGNTRIRNITGSDVSLLIEAVNNERDASISLKSGSGSTWSLGTTNYQFSNGLTIRNGAIGTTEKFTILNSGNVGIGTTSPAYKLDVNGTARIGGTQVRAEFDTVNGNYKFRGANGNFGIDIGYSAVNSGGYISSPANGLSMLSTVYWENGTDARAITRNVPFNWDIYAAASWNIRDLTTLKSLFSVKTNGNVGIGTNTPTASLHVSKTAPIGTISSVGAAVTGVGTNFTASLSSGDTIIANGQIRTVNTVVSDTSLTVTTAFSPDLTSGTMFSRIGAIFNSGNVGIGTASPAFKLDVTGDINASGSVRAAGIALTSDARYKKDVIDITSPLETITKLHPVKYTWNELGISRGGRADTLQYGFLAQELETVLPSLVETDAAGYKAVNYIGLTPVLVEAVKELNLKVDMAVLNTGNTSSTGFFDALKNWLGNTTNGLIEITADSLRARKQICIDDVCITKDELRTILQNNHVGTTGTASNTNTPSGTVDSNTSGSISTDSSNSNVDTSIGVDGSAGTVPTDTTESPTTTPDTSVPADSSAPVIVDTGSTATTHTTE